MAQGVADSKCSRTTRSCPTAMPPTTSSRRCCRSIMQSFAKPWYKLRSLRIFRDDTTLVLTPHLWPDDPQCARCLALLRSARLAQGGAIALGAAGGLALDHRRAAPDSLLIVLTEGTIDWDDDTNDFDWTATTALPPVMKGAFKDEPKWEDVAALINPADLTMQNPVLRKTVASLYSAITGRPLDAVIGEDVRQHRRTRLIAASTLAAILIGWHRLWLARVGERQAEPARAAAGRPAAWRVAAFTFASSGRAGALPDRARRCRHGDEPDAGRSGTRPRCAGSAAGGRREHISRCSRACTAILSRPSCQRKAQPGTVAFSPQGQILVAAERTVAGVRPGQPRHRKRACSTRAMSSRPPFSKDGASVLTAARDRKARIWDHCQAHGARIRARRRGADGRLRPRRKIGRHRLPRRHAPSSGTPRPARKCGFCEHESDVTDVAWLNGSARLVTVTQRGMLRAWDVATGVKLFEATTGRDMRADQRQHQSRRNTGRHCRGPVDRPFCGTPRTAASSPAWRTAARS